MRGKLPHFININIIDPYNVKALDELHYEEDEEKWPLAKEF